MHLPERIFPFTLQPKPDKRQVGQPFEQDHQPAAGTEKVEEYAPVHTSCFFLLAGEERDQPLDESGFGKARSGDTSTDAIHQGDRPVQPGEKS